MKTKTLPLTVAVCFAAGTVCFAASDPQMGTWKLNEAKSKFAPGTAKNTKVVYKAAGDSVKVTIDGTDANGKPAHNEWMGKFDGKDYPVSGDPTSDMRSYKKVDDRTLVLTVTKGGKVTAAGRIVVSADGKSRTVTTYEKADAAPDAASEAAYLKKHGYSTKSSFGSMPEAEAEFWTSGGRRGSLSGTNSKDKKFKRTTAVYDKQ
jgi:hypothetical protein